MRRTDSLTDLGVEVIAHRLRTLGHPLRLRIVRALDRRHATIEQLAAELGASPAAVAAHLRLLTGCGVVCRADDSGLATYVLADWPSLWLVEQLAHRLALQAAGNEHGESAAGREAR